MDMGTFILGVLFGWLAEWIYVTFFGNKGSDGLSDCTAYERELKTRNEEIKSLKATLSDASTGTTSGASLMTTPVVGKNSASAENSASAKNSAPAKKTTGKAPATGSKSTTKAETSTASSATTTTKKASPTKSKVAPTNTSSSSKKTTAKSATAVKSATAAKSATVKTSTVTKKTTTAKKPAKASSSTTKKTATTKTSASNAKVTTKKATSIAKKPTAKNSTKTTTTQATAKKAPVRKPGSKKIALKKDIKLNNPSGDDLTKLSGIGPSMAATMNELGITSYAKLAAMDDDILRDMLEASGARLNNNKKAMDSWNEQATLAGKGDFEGLKKLQKALQS